MNLSEFANYFVALLVITNPLSALPAILRVTRHQSDQQKKRTALIATFAIGIILLIATWIGTPLLAILGIGVPSFQVAGGMVLLTLAFSMLNATESPIKQTIEEQKEKISDNGAIVPLAIPIIAGPGAMSTIIVSVNLYQGVLNQIFLSIAALLVTLALGSVLFFSSTLEKMIGTQGINIFNRIGGLLLASIAIQALANGALGLFPGWAAK